MPNIPESERTDTTAIIRALAYAYLELRSDKRLDKFPILTTGYTIAVADELGLLDPTGVRVPFLELCDALDVQTDFDTDPDGWMDRYEFTSHMTAKDVIDQTVTHALTNVLRLAVRAA